MPDELLTWPGCFDAALSEGFCPECQVPLVPHSNLGYCPRCQAYWSRNLTEGTPDATA